MTAARPMLGALCAVVLALTSGCSTSNEGKPVQQQQRVDAIKDEQRAAVERARHELTTAAAVPELGLTSILIPEPIIEDCGNEGGNSLVKFTFFVDQHHVADAALAADTAAAHFTRRGYQVDRNHVDFGGEAGMQYGVLARAKALPAVSLGVNNLALGMYVSTPCLPSTRAQREFLGVSE